MQERLVTTTDFGKRATGWIGLPHGAYGRLANAGPAWVKEPVRFSLNSAVDSRGSGLGRRPDPAA